MRRSLAFALVFALPLVSGGPGPQSFAWTHGMPLGRSAQRAEPNDNRSPAGPMERDRLVLRLTIAAADWHILGDSNPPFHVLAFAEVGKPPTIPGPLIRVGAGTPIRVHLRNPLDDTLVIKGSLDQNLPRASSTWMIPMAYAPVHPGVEARHSGSSEGENDRSRPSSGT